MSRLITEDDVYEYLTDKFNEYDISIENEFAGKILDGLDEIPTAFDAEKVVAELKEWTFNADINIGDGTIMNHNLITSKNAIDIVRKGGVECIK